jgi:hypothetical protein
MSTNVRTIRCTPEELFAILADGWLFPVWVVGASRLRNVDDSWPGVGSKLHHSFGSWPLLLNDETEVLEWDPPRWVKLRPKGWPIGETHVTLEVKPRGDGCVVRMCEEAVAGPGKLVPAPLMDLLLYPRNVETLRRLAFIAEGKTD